MKFKENFKRFFTLDRHHDAGFTLVELIVVIAILAILAGVAVPAYTGYIKKAEEAADLQLLGALNTAFAAACMQSSVDVDDMLGAEINLIAADDGKQIDAENPINITGTAAYTKAETLSEETLVGGALLQKTLNEAFTLFFGDNFTTPFKVYIEIVYAEGGFQGYTAEDKASLGGNFTTIFDSIKDKISGSANKVTISTFGDIGAKDLMGKVDSVTQLAAGLANMNGTFKDALSNNLDSLGASLGLDPESDTFEDDCFAKLGELAIKIDPSLADAEGDEYSNKFNAATSQILANYAVLEAAKSTTKTTDQLLEDMQKGIKVDDIKNLLKNGDKDGSTQEGLSQAAMMYAMYTAYANQMPEGTAEEKAAKDKALEAAKTTEGFMMNMTSDGFTAYLKNEDGKAKEDLEGYLGALDIINQSAAKDSAAVEDLLVNGYNDPALINALQGLLGK